MEKIPYGRYTKEFREEAARLVLEDSLSVGEAAKRLSLPKSTLEAWVRAAKTGKLGNIGKNRPPLTEVEVELAKVKRELVAGLLGVRLDFRDYWGVRLDFLPFSRMM